MQDCIPNNIHKPRTPDTGNSSGPSRVIKFNGYCVLDPDSLETPAMVLFEQRLEHNIRSVCELVGGGRNLFAHVKTHKCGAVARRQVEHGITAFKCATLKELEMVLQVGASAAILAFPQVQKRKIDRFCELTMAHPDARVMATVSSPVHLQLLADTAAQRQQTLPVMVDLDAGMHRTGIGFGPEAIQLYKDIHAHPFLQAAGLHLYDGHENYSNPDERAAHAQGHIRALRDFQREIESMGMTVPLVVAGGSWSFPWYARADGIYGSPGSFIYWDAGYRSAMPDLPFRWAALVLTQVVDRFPKEGRFTTDLGSKGISSDLPENKRAVLLGYETADLVLQSEEHGVFEYEGDLPGVGAYLLAVPGHICPTTIRYPGIHVIDAEGNVVDYFTHTARDRE